MANFKMTIWCSSLVALGACAKGGGHSRLQDMLPYEIGEIEPRLGNGYDSLVQELRNTPSCVAGETSKVSSGRSTIDITQNVDSDKLMKEFSGDVKGTPRFIFKEAGAAAGYFRSLNRSNGALNLVYAVKVDQGGEGLSRVTLTDDSKSLSPSALLEKCGDNYVAQINRGGMLTITVSFDFLNEESRNKWQSQLKLSGSWADVSHDLANKIEKGGIDSRMSVKVVQLGGTPSQALTAAKSCSLTSLDDFNACKQKVDDLMTYANTAFPQQIESNPAILQYVTLPLKGLGVRDLPAVNQDVLDIRKNLATFNAQAVEMSEMLAKGKDVGVEFEPSLASAITNNLDLIKEAAKACYSYQVKGASIDWSDCVSQGKSIASKLTKIDRSRVIIHELSVPANSEVGNSILNNYSSPMKINYALGKRKTWYIDNATEVDVEGLTTQGRGYSATDSVSSSSKRGALLVGQDSSIFTADRSGKFDIDGGEALRFMMNDSVGQYDDNRGTQTIYWRCTNCSETAKEAPTFRLRVKANDENGAIFNSRWDLSGTYRVRAYGSWRSSRSNLATNPGGNSKNCGSRCTVADASFQTLVMKGEYDSVGVTIGSDKTLAIKGRQPIHFMINDQAGGFTDNSGSVEVILQCVANCENLKSHPIILDEEE